MLFVNAVAALALMATSVLADGPAIVSAIHTIDSKTAALNTTVVDWDGSLFGAIPILTATTDLQNAINSGTSTANASAPLTSNEAVDVYNAVVALQKDVNVTLTSLINRKPDFDKDSITFITTSALKDTKTDSDQFATAVVNKVPAGLQDFARTVVQQIDDSFAKAIAVYSN